MTEIAIPAPSGVNSFGVHLLVDFKPIEDADTLLEECKRFVEETQTELYVVPFAPTFSRLVNNVRQWRMKRKDQRLQGIFDSLLPRVQQCEKDLRQIIGDVVEKKAALRVQAKHLQLRLSCCIAHNQSLLVETDSPLDDIRSYVNILSDEQTALKQMLTFNAEVLRLRNAEANAKRQQALRWGGLGAMKNKLANSKNKQKNGERETETVKDEDHSILELRLKNCRTIRQSCVGLLSVLLERRGVQQSHVDHCLSSLDALQQVVSRRDNNSNSTTTGTEEERESNSFEHSRCADCSYGYTMADDCLSHLAALQKQAIEANLRLHSLVETRERMIDAMEAMKRQEREANGERGSMLERETEVKDRDRDTDS